MFLSWYIRMFSDYNRYNLCVRSFSIHFRMCVNNINRPFPFICWNDLFTLPCRIRSLWQKFLMSTRKYFDTVSVYRTEVFWHRFSCTGRSVFFRIIDQNCVRPYTETVSQVSIYHNVLQAWCLVVPSLLLRVSSTRWQLVLLVTPYPWKYP